MLAALERKNYPVSIRSPYRSKGRSQPTVTHTPPAQFQSAPLTEARGDSCCSASATWFIRFQSAPLTEARGDADQRTSQAHLGSFNPLPLPKQGEIS